MKCSKNNEWKKEIRNNKTWNMNTVFSHPCLSLFTHFLLHCTWQEIVELNLPLNSCSTREKQALASASHSAEMDKTWWVFTSVCPLYSQQHHLILFKQGKWLSATPISIQCANATPNQKNKKPYETLVLQSFMFSIWDSVVHMQSRSCWIFLNSIKRVIHNCSIV